MLNILKFCSACRALVRLKPRVDKMAEREKFQILKYLTRTVPAVIIAASAVLSSTTPSFADGYNSAGGVVIEQTPSQSVTNSQVLVSCEDEPKLCANPEGPGKSQDAPPGPPNGGPGPHSRH